MKRKPVPLLKIGIFVLLGFIILVVFIFLIGSKEKLFSSTTEVKARFVTVSSLKKGAPVQISGINIGSVKDIDLPRNARDSVTVTMKLLTDALKLVHTDSRAIISTEGLIGEKIVVITMGGDSTVAVAPNSTLVGQAPKDFTALYDTLNRTITQVNELATQATDMVYNLYHGEGTVSRLINDDQLYRNANAVAMETRATVVEARKAVDRISTDFNSFSGRANTVVASINDVTTRINRGEGSLGKLLTSDDIYNDFKRTSSNINLASYDMRDAIAKIDLGAGRFAEITEAFKHNFLIKSYFENRGYWDTPEFEMTIDRKIDSLNRLRESIDRKISVVKPTNFKETSQNPGH